MTKKPVGWSTRVIHAGREPKQRTGAVSVPIYATTTFELAEVGRSQAGYVYSRTHNPTRSALEECLAAMEDAKHALAFASGLAAIDAVLRSTCRPGDHILLAHDMFSISFRLVDRVLSDWGLEYSMVDQTDLEATRAAIRPNTKVLWTESPSNPLLNIVDLVALGEIAHESGALLIVDNALSSPYLQRPLTLGADVVVYSTKYIAGHSDVINGAIVTDDDLLAESIQFIQNSTGGTPSPFDAWLVQRGAKTLALRMEKHCDNAEYLVEQLQRHALVSQVIYPGLVEHPQHKLAVEQMRRFGGVVGFRVKGGAEAAIRLCNSTELFKLVEGFGGVESSIMYPREMSHSTNANRLEPIPEDFVRISVGIEEPGDLVDDLYRALG